MDALLTSSAWGICLITHLFHVSWSTFVATCVVLTHQLHVLFSFWLTSAVPWWLTYGLCLDHLVLIVCLFGLCFLCSTISSVCSKFYALIILLYASQWCGMFSWDAVSLVTLSSLPLAFNPTPLISMCSSKCLVGILPLHSRSARSRLFLGGVVVKNPPLFLSTQVLRKVASFNLACLCRNPAVS